MKEYFVLLGGNKLLWGQVCKLREFGYKVIVIAWNDHPDIQGDLFIQMDVKDKDGIIRKLEELGLKDHVDGALSSIDLAAPTVNAINKWAGNKYMPSKFDEVLTKEEMRNCWMKAGVFNRISKLDDEFPLDEIIKRLRGTSKSIIFTDDDIDSLLELQYGRADTLMILMMLYPSLDYNNKFHVDHIYPKSKFTKSSLQKKGIAKNKIEEYMNHVNDISNLQLLAAIPNIEKQDKDFEVWFAENYPTDTDKIEYRRINYLPDMQYNYNSFLKFVSYRRQLLKKQLESELK